MNITGNSFIIFSHFLSAPAKRTVFKTYTSVGPGEGVALSAEYSGHFLGGNESFVLYGFIFLMSGECKILFQLSQFQNSQ